MAQNLYEVIMIQRPTAEQREQGEKDKLILLPTYAMAEKSDQAVAVVSKENAVLLKDVDLSTVDIIVRQFRP